LVHKTANVFNKMPKALQAKAKSDLHQIWFAESRDAAIKSLQSLPGQVRGEA